MQNTAYQIHMNNTKLILQNFIYKNPILLNRKKNWCIKNRLEKTTPL